MNDSSADGPTGRWSRFVIVILCFLAIGGSALSLVRFEEENAEENSRWYEITTGREKLFYLDDLTIPRKEVLVGNPQVDGIPTLNDAAYIPAKKAEYLNPEDEVIGVIFQNQARAYPLKVLDYHEGVNTSIGDDSYFVSYCPLCRSVAVYETGRIEDRTEFGVSGYLYKSNVLFYYRDPGAKAFSLFSQMKRQGVSGPKKEKSLRLLPCELTSWEDWLERHPETEVLSAETGHLRDYNENPYESYASHNELMFPAEPQDNRYRKFAQILGIIVGDEVRAYPYPEFESDTQIEAELNGKQFTLIWDESAKSLRVAEAEEGVAWMYSYWFAWFAFYPETEVYTGKTAD